MLYDLLLDVGKAGFMAASPFNTKAAQWYHGQQGLIERIENDMKDVTADVVWFHCASLGEFEQGRQLIEDWKEKRPTDVIVITFFSPSGYEVRKNYGGADHIYYLPLDTSRNAARFVAAVKPKYALFIKYEYWNNYTKELQKAGTKSYVVSAIFREGDAFFSAWGGPYRAILHRFDHIFLQNEASKKLLETIGITNTTVCGDTRFDRVVKIAGDVKPIEKIEAFRGDDGNIFISGSSWPADDDITIELIGAFPDMKFIIVPHEIEESKIRSIVERCEAKGRKTVRYGKENAIDQFKEASVLIIDAIGILSSAYSYCKYAFIGGGFGAGIHNTLEAATFGLPIIFGPKYERFDEAIALEKNGTATVITSADDAIQWLTSMSGDEVLYNKISASAKEFVKKNSGASTEILKQILG